jgi:hypothetical protein
MEIIQYSSNYAKKVADHFYYTVHEIESLYYIEEQKKPYLLLINSTTIQRECSIKHR